MRRQVRTALFRTSTGIDERRAYQSRHVADSSAASRRLMSAMELKSANRDGVWPRNYRLRIRAPGSVEGAVD